PLGRVGAPRPVALHLAPPEAARSAAPPRCRAADRVGHLACHPPALPPYPRAGRVRGRRSLGPARARAPLLRALAARLSRAALRPDARAGATSGFGCRREPRHAGRARRSRAEPLAARGALAARPRARRAARPDAPGARWLRPPGDRCRRACRRGDPRMISVIIPAHDEERYVGPTIAALCAATPFEVLVVANACRDRTAEVACAHGARVLSTPVRGVSHARNLGARASGGEVLVFL